MANLLYSDIVQDLEKKIMSNELKVTDKLPSERELAAQYDVSRNVVREAIMVLRVNGLVEIKPGKGVYITKPGEEIVTDSLQRVLRSNDVTREDILDVREELEMMILKKVVERATADSINQLKEIYRKMEEKKHFVNQFIDLDAEFHLTLARATQNNAFYVLIHSFFDLTERGLLNMTTYTPSSVNDAQVHHNLIIRAIEQRDERLAVSTIKEHLGLLRQEIKVLKEQGIIKE